ncbi:sensor domain-containing diguanylate cyclase [Azomonas macrocytogenes]|uniref:diguanylate cyclase n=1 Tax=Azomonas macrocytogenes TaxID=69962 RepID=A0A839SZM6_AZOMA|nr:sensor domain-containing diguanylate cyclase [Azomonas macrocytogenes]MBB3102602.1 diguanylate cyclase (GGDEF)-like protein [Azomonas macrocytogenes]
MSYSKTLPQIPLDSDQTTKQASILLTVVCVTILALSIWQVREEYTDQAHQYQKDVANLSAALLHNTEASILHSSTILLGLIERLQNDGSNPAALERLSHLARVQAGFYPELQGIFLYDAKGKWLLSTLPLKSGVNNADRDYFRHHLLDSGLGTHIGTPIRSRTTNDWIITVSHRINDLDGKFAGVALATLRAQTFLDFYKSLNLGPQGIIHLARTDGSILVRYPFREEDLPKGTASGLLVQAIQQGSEQGVLILDSPFDGVRRISGYTASKILPIYMAVGLDESYAFESWRKSLYATSAAVLVALAVIISFGLKIIGSIRFRQQEELQLQQAYATLAEANRGLEIQASQDALTGLANRRQLEIALSQHFLRAEFNNEPLSFILLDIDNFKSYNDTYGHQAGDRCLRQVGNCICRQLRSHSDIPARYGGEELAIILPRTGKTGAKIVAEKIRVAIFEERIEHAGSSLGWLTVSLGVATGTPGPQCTAPNDLILEADKALYEAKRTGRNRVAFGSQDVEPHQS